MEALALLGVAVDDANPQRWMVHGRGGDLVCPEKDIYLGNNGTATRFLTSVAALARAECVSPVLRVWRRGHSNPCWRPWRRGGVGGAARIPQGPTWVGPPKCGKIRSPQGGIQGGGGPQFGPLGLRGAKERRGQAAIIPPLPYKTPLGWAPGKMGGRQPPGGKERFPERDKNLGPRGGNSRAGPL